MSGEDKASCYGSAAGAAAPKLSILTSLTPWVLPAIKTAFSMASAESALPYRLTTPSLNLTFKPATSWFTPASFSLNLPGASSTKLKTFLSKFDAKPNNPTAIPLLLIYFKKLFNKLPTRSLASDWLPLSELPPSIEPITESSKVKLTNAGGK